MPLLRHMIPINPRIARRSLPNFMLLCIGLLSCFFSGLSAAATQEQIRQVQQAAEQHILSTIQSPQGAQLTAQASTIDTRIYLTDCPEPLHTSANSHNPSASTITVLVECPSDNWQLYVPVRLTLTSAQVIIATSLPKGHILTASDLNITMNKVSRFRSGSFSNPQEVIGAKLKKNMKVGDFISENDICIVCRNENVIIKATHGAMTITTKGTALTDGTFGTQIRVKNERSNRIISARITNVGEVTVSF